MKVKKLLRMLDYAIQVRIYPVYEERAVGLDDLLTYHGTLGEMPYELLTFIGECKLYRGVYLCNGELCIELDNEPTAIRCQP